MERPKLDWFTVSRMGWVSFEVKEGNLGVEVGPGKLCWGILQDERRVKR